MALISPSRINALKNRVRAECARRNSNGSVSSYAGSAYDFTLMPADGTLIKAEHYDKNATPLNAINSKIVSRASSGGYIVKENDFVQMEAFLATIESRNLYDSTASDCSASCTGLCYSCTGTCSGGCSGCTGCTGCGGCGGCDGSCSGCSGTCTGGCSGCSGCGESCSYSCSSCSGGCSGSCLGCSGTCTGCSGCSDACSYGCGSGCTGCSGSK